MCNGMAPVTVVGLGPGAVEYLTPAAEQAVNRADVLVGGRRQLEMFGHLPARVTRHAITANLAPLPGIIQKEVSAGKHVVVLASGDPGFYGILSTLGRLLPEINPTVVPGISSFQLACARLGITWEDAYLTSCHGREPAALAAAVKKHRKVITLTDPRHNPPALARALLAVGTGDLEVHVACDLTYPNERVVSMTLKQLAGEEEWPSSNCVMVIINEE